MKYLVNIFAFLFTAGFFGHDIHYTFKYIGITFTSIFFLLGLFWFHTMILFKESGLGEIHCRKALRSISWMRVIILALSILCVLKETIGSIPLHLVSWDSVGECAVSIIMVVFPDKVFHLMFQLKAKKKFRKLVPKKNIPENNQVLQSSDNSHDPHG